MFVVLVIIHEIFMWINGYFTSSAAIVLTRRRHHRLLPSSSTIVACHRHARLPPLSSSAVVLVVHHGRLSVKNLHLHTLSVTSADFLHKMYPQITRCNICISAFYHWPMAVSWCSVTFCYGFMKFDQCPVASCVNTHCAGLWRSVAGRYNL